jgi:hypothetical protein
MDVNELIYGLSVYALAILFHEFGHFLVAKYYNKFVKVEFDIIVPDIVYLTDNQEEEIQILTYGIMFGLIIMLTYGIYLQNKYHNNGLLLGSVFIICYFIGSFSDINRLIEIIKKK